MVDGPLACFITWRTYGTWLPGDPRGTVDRWHNLPGTPRAPANARREEHARSLLKQPPVTFDDRLRALADAALREACEESGWQLLALNVRTNHVHLLVATSDAPEKVMHRLKSACTKRLRAQGAVGAGDRVWARHGSTRQLFSPRAVEAAWNYVVYGQDEPPVR